MKKALVAAVAIGAGVAAWLLLAGETKKPVREPATVDNASEPGPAVEPPPAPPPVPPPVPPIGASQNRLAGRPLPGGAQSPQPGAPSLGGGPDPQARPGTLGAGVGEAGKAPPPRLEIVDPPADSTDPGDRTARLAAQAFRGVVKAMKLDADQEDRFKQLLYDSRQSFEASLAMARKAMETDKLDVAQRAAGEVEARKKAWDDQKEAADETVKELLGEAQLKVYRTLVQNPLFLANGLHFKVNEDPTAAPPQ